jgi:hypothetical protein
MTINATLQLALEDPLSDVTRRERKFLLGTSAIAIIVSQTGMVPSKVSALGIDFEAADQAALLRVFAAVIAYFFAAFVIYGCSDYLHWRLRYDDARKTLFLNHVKNIDINKLDEYAVDHPLRLRGLQRISPLVSIMRGIFEFLLPLLVAAASIYLLLTHRLAVV